MPDKPIYIRKRIWIKGVVQGIGFRPYIYLLATKKELTGNVFNTEQGVTIEVEGDEENVNAFLSDLQTNHPPLAQINGFDISTIPLKGEKSFIIRKSSKGIDPKVVIPPDLAICPDCLKELTHPSDRRYNYPFINCTQCGPRLTIIKNVPYDRENTSMSSFDMCKACEMEFHDPGSRRFHAQPNACVRCGPHIWLAHSDGTPISIHDPIKHACKLLREGAILAIKGLGGFHLAVDATREEAVKALRFRKAREEKPLAIMSENIQKIKQYAELTEEEIDLLMSPAHPIVLLKKKETNPIAPSVAPNQRNFGVMLPYTPLHVLILREGFIALVMTSGNLSNEPIAIDNQEAIDSLSKIADYFLFHNRDILVRCDDSVIMPLQTGPLMIRRSRGYVPLPLIIKGSYDPVLALGGQMKNTICVLRDNLAFLSQHVGDLEGPGARRFFGESLQRIQEIAGIFPKVVAHDIHPDYYTTKFIENMKDKSHIAVQHHHAHLVSCLADNDMEGPVIGLIFDGTGYGTDGTIWGGEALMGDETAFERLAHLSPFHLPGGEAAILHPWRIALALLYQSARERCHYDLPDMIHHLISQEGLTEADLSLIYHAIKKGINTPATSSMGRLFDGVSALLGFRGRIAFEGQAAIELEYLASLSQDIGAYPAVIHHEALPWQMQFEPIVREIIHDIDDQIPRETISRKFHNTIIQMAYETALLACERFSLNHVVLSGGCFQNRLLVEGVVSLLKEAGIHAFTHHNIPTNDGGISLGQAVCAGAYLKKAHAMP